MYAKSAGQINQVMSPGSIWSQFIWTRFALFISQVWITFDAKFVQHESITMHITEM